MLHSRTCGAEGGGHRGVTGAKFLKSLFYLVADDQARRCGHGGKLVRSKYEQGKLAFGRTRLLQGAHHWGCITRVSHAPVSFFVGTLESQAFGSA